VDKFAAYNDFDEALEHFRAEKSDCKIETFTGDTNQLSAGFGIKEYPHPTDTSIPKYLLKVGSEQYMLQLLKLGIVYMNSLGYFRELEVSGDGRADSSEGAHSIVQTSGLIIDGLQINIPTPLTFTVSNQHCGYVYSMVGVYDDSNHSDILNEDMLNMGDTAIVIHDPNKFIKRCSAALESHHKKLEWGRVHYYDKSEGSFFLNPWLKPKEFEYQREFRLYFAMKETKAKVLQIGSIEDIACAYHISLRGA
jgi:hypothetical protein